MKRLRILRLFCVLLGFALAGGHAAAGLAQEPFALLGDDTVRDQAGRELRVQRPFQRIVSLYGAHTENLFALGAGRQLIGVSRNEAYPPEARKKGGFSYREDPEKFLAARPDLVLIRPMIDRGYPQLVARLESSGIAVVSLQPSTVDSLYTYWRILGLLAGRPAEAERLIDHFDRACRSLAALGSGVADRQRVYFEAVHSKMKTFSPDSMAIFALESAGGINVAADALPVRNTNIAAYGKERILAQADRIDVYLAQVGTMNQPTVELIRNEPGFSALKAVQTGRVYLIDEMIVSRPTPRLLEGIYQIGRRLYPEVFDQQVGNLVQEKIAEATGKGNP
jgi:iron complex transport system substrate-binding protein